MKNRIRVERAEVRMTQQQLADAIGVSRQTVSNWETGKTYPDIVSVIRMSGLYSVSLDCLLKEEKTVSNDLNYLNYLEESTNAVKSRRRLGKLVLVGGGMPADNTRGDGTAWYRPLCFHGRRSVPNRPSPSMRRDAVAKAL